MFNVESVIVQTWVKAVRSGVKKHDEVPNLYNLRTVVISILEGGE